MSAWPWPSSENTKAVIAAFVTALQGVEDVARTKTVNAGNMRYNYADLDAVLEAAKPMLTAQGLAVTQAAAGDGVHAVVMHSSGEWLSFPPLQVSTQQNTPQAQGSALTYARRYQMLALLGIATEDDDGKAASKPRKTTPRPNPAPGADEAVNPGAPTDSQRTKAQALAKELWGDDRDTRLHNWTVWCQREVSSFNDLTRKEASDVIERMQNQRSAA